MTTPTRTTKPGAETQLRSFIAKFDAKNAATIRAVRRSLRARFPTAIEMVYDNYNFFVIGYSPTARPSDAIISMAADKNGVGLCFIHGARLPDPKGILLGAGKQTRFIRLATAADLARPAVDALLSAAVANAKIPFAAEAKHELVIRSISKKQRPRR